jgi:protease-4
MRPEEREYIQSGIEKTYQDFISHVSEGRGMSVSTVDSIGQGRVWSGVNAKENGLVDTFGGLTKAVDIAAEMADLDHYRIVEYPELEDPFDMILRNLYNEIRAKNMKAELGEYYTLYEELQSFKNSFQIQMRLPYYFKVY